ncbi:hypothetical protein [Bradyrhizobium phage BDU-MI-1]|nr:hypothetical protein [Bradyrhizobium phage BDU-MI-1]
MTKTPKATPTPDAETAFCSSPYCAYLPFTRHVVRYGLKEWPSHSVRVFSWDDPSEELPAPIEYVLVAHSMYDIDDLITWLDDHPSDDELRERAIDTPVRWDAIGFLNGVLQRDESAFPARIRLPDNKDLREVLEMVIEDYAEVESAHRAEFHTYIEARNVQDPD